MNKIIFAISIITATSMGYWVGKNDSISGASVPSSVTSAVESRKISSVANISQHPVEPNIQHSDAAKEQSSLSPEQLISGQRPQQQIDAIKAQYEFEQRSEKFTNWLTKNQKDKPWFDLGVEMSGRFAAEETDYSWATTEEGYLQTLFTQDASLAGIALKSTSCKSTQCQITVSVMDQDHANETAMAITKVIGSNKSTQIIVDNKVKQGEATFYVSRNEKGFEFN